MRRQFEVNGFGAAAVIKAAAVMRQIATATEKPPTHLLLGSDSLEFVRGKLNAMQEALGRWEA